MSRIVLVLGVFLSGCQISEEDADFDADGFLPASYGGEDCDNRNPDVTLSSTPFMPIMMETPTAILSVRSSTVWHQPATSPTTATATTPTIRGGGIVAGFNNTISEQGASVVGGLNNEGTSSWSVVVGGTLNAASNLAAAVLSAWSNEAAGAYSSVYWRDEQSS